MKIDTKQELIDQVEEILYEVQYAKLGFKAQARSKAAKELVEAILTAYKIHKRISNG